MVVVKLELWPKGDWQKREPIGIVAITNDGTGTSNKGNYHVSISKELGQVYATARVEGFRRKKKDGFELLYLALKEIYEGE